MGFQTLMWRSGSCLERKELKRRKLQYINVISTLLLTRFSLKYHPSKYLNDQFYSNSSLKFPGNKSETAHWTLQWWTLIPLEGMNWLDDFNSDVRLRVRLQLKPTGILECYCAGRNSSGHQETKQWQDMIANPRQSAVVWHRSLLSTDFLWLNTWLRNA